MIQSIFLCITLVALRSAIAPARRSLTGTANRSRMSPLDYHDTARIMLPLIALTWACNIAALGAMLHLLGAFATPASHGPSIVMSLAVFYTGLLSLLALGCARKLKEAESGLPDPVRRKFLMREMVAFPLIPMIASVIVNHP